MKRLARYVFGVGLLTVLSMDLIPDPQTRELQPILNSCIEADEEDQPDTTGYSCPTGPEQ